MGHHKYGVILDAGSSGTRIHIYRWDDPLYARSRGTAEELASLPKIETKKKWTKKISPGVSTFGTKPTDIGPSHLAGLFEHASSVIPRKEIRDTPLFLLATAGMRLLPERQRNELLSEICAYARMNTEFYLPDCDTHIRVIQGETEGLYGWIAANYLVGGFDNINARDRHAHHTYGFLDMGGASAQIAFAPNSTEAEKHANDLKLLRLRQLDGMDVEYRVFVTTWLGFGVNEARKRYVHRLVEASGAAGVKEIPDPCLPKGLLETLDGKEIEDAKKSKDAVHLIGTGKFTECESQVYPLLDKDKPCMDAPCLLNGVHVPAIDFDINHFVGVAEYWHTTHEIFEAAHATKAYDFATYSQRVKEFCERDWSSIEADVHKEKWGKKVDEKKAMEVCFKASWIINVLHDGIGIPRVGIEDTPKSSHNGTQEVVEAAVAKGFIQPFRPVNKIDDVEVSWTLGRMVLWTAAQVPPAVVGGKAELPVGFGDNIITADGMPEGFQYGATKLVTDDVNLSDSIDYNSTDSGGAHWHDPIWKEGEPTPRRIPSILFFLAIFGLVAILIMGPDRRRRLFRAFQRSSPFKSRGRKVLGSSGSVVYERLMEEGSPRFELGSFDEDDGWDHQRLKGGVFSPTTDSAAASSRQGLGPRTQSRERLHTRSRDVSPVRGTARARSPMPPRSPL